MAIYPTLHECLYSIDISPDAWVSSIYYSSDEGTEHLIELVRSIHQIPGFQEHAKLREVARVARAFLQQGRHLYPTAYLTAYLADEMPSYMKRNIDQWPDSEEDDFRKRVSHTSLAAIPTWPHHPAAHGAKREISLTDDTLLDLEGSPDSRKRVSYLSQ